jgi:hypothetical protein
VVRKKISSHYEPVQPAPSLLQKPSRKVWEKAMRQASGLQAKTASRSLGECMGEVLKTDIFRFSPSARSFRTSENRVHVRVCLSACEAPDSTNSLPFWASVSKNSTGQACLSLRAGSFAESMPLCALELVCIDAHSFVMVPLMLGKLSQSDICSTIQDLTTLVFQDERQTDQFLSLLAAAGAQGHDH